jgi:hypothetical protein
MSKNTDKFDEICGDCTDLEMLYITEEDVREMAALWVIDSEEEIQLALAGLAEYQSVAWFKDYIDGCHANGVDPSSPIVEYSNCKEAEITDDGVWACGAWWDAEKVAAFRNWIEQQ